MEKPLYKEIGKIGSYLANRIGEGLIKLESWMQDFEDRPYREKGLEGEELERTKLRGKAEMEKSLIKLLNSPI